MIEHESKIFLGGLKGGPNPFPNYAKNFWIRPFSDPPGHSQLTWALVPDRVRVSVSRAWELKTFVYLVAARKLRAFTHAFKEKRVNVLSSRAAIMYTHAFFTGLVVNSAQGLTQGFENDLLILNHILAKRWRYCYKKIFFCQFNDYILLKCLLMNDLLCYILICGNLK